MSRKCLGSVLAVDVSKQVREDEHVDSEEWEELDGEDRRVDLGSVQEVSRKCRRKCT